MERLYASKYNRFIDLARISELDPAQDFQACDLRGCNFRNQNLLPFDLSGSILYGSDIRGAVFGEKTIRSAFFFEFETDFPQEVQLAGRKFVTSNSYQERSAFLIALLTVADIRQAENYTRFQKSRDRSERVRTAIGLAEKSLSQGDQRLAILEVGNFLDRTVRSGYPMARYQFREAFDNVRRVFPQAVKHLPKF